MNRTNWGRILVLAAVAIYAAAPSRACAATLLYEQTFNPPAPGQSGAILPWSINMLGGFEGTYSGTFAPLNMLVDAGTNLPINGNTGVYTGIGGAVTANLRAFYTVDGVAGFTAFDPATCQNCTFSVYANRQPQNSAAGGLDDVGYFIVNAGPGGRNPSQWYISATPMGPLPLHSNGNLFDLQALLYNPAAGNWNNLTIDSTNAVAPVVGGPAGSLAGLLITGVGVLQSVTSPAGDFTSWNYADYRITCGAPSPEPASLVLMACGGLALLWYRRAK